MIICDREKKSIPVAWSSARLKRVARSTLVAETLALPDAYDATFYVFRVFNDTLMNRKTTIKAFTVNQSLYDTIKTTKLAVDRQLRVEISALRNMYKREEIEMHWISKYLQLNNNLPKKAPRRMMLV